MNQTYINKPSFVPELSVVILCYKSGKTVIPYVARMEEELQKGGVQNYELILVGNYFPGKGDITPDVIRELSKNNPKIKALTLEKKGMLGWDVIQGFRAATGSTIALIDGDGQMPSRDVTRLYNVLKSGEFDMVKTFRKSRMDGAYRRFISGVYNFIFRNLFPNSFFCDINSKPKLITREAYEKMDLSCEGWFIDGEIMLEVMRLDLTFAEIPTVFLENEWRGSFVKIWTIFEFLLNMAKYRVKYWFK